MKARIRQLINERLSTLICDEVMRNNGLIRDEVARIKGRPKKKKTQRRRCHCNDYVGCKTCRSRLWQFNKRRKAAGMKPLPMPPPKPRPLVCECGECDKCIHRFKVREWRRMEREWNVELANMGKRK